MARIDPLRNFRFRLDLLDIRNRDVKNPRHCSFTRAVVAR